MSDENTLWMGDIEPWMTESIIINSFQYFNIYPINVKLIKDKKKKINRTYCFVKFKNTEDVNNALINLNGKKIPSCNINFKLNWADYNTNNITRIIYVGNLNMNITDNELYNLFSQKYKSVHHANVIYENGISKGYGFVIFKNEEEYYRCLKEMNGYNYYGNKIKVREKRKNDDNENKNKEKYYNKNNILNNKNNNDINSSVIYLNSFQKMNLNNNNSIQNSNLINNMTLSKLPNNNLNNNIIITNINNMNNLENNNNNSINFNNINNNNIINNNQMNSNLNDINQQLPLNLLLNKLNSSMNHFYQNNNTLNKETNQKDIISNSNNYIKNEIRNEIRNEKAKKSEQDKNRKNNNKNKLKLEILDNIDELTLNKKIHESILKTFEFYKKLFISSGTKIKSK